VTRPAARATFDVQRFAAFTDTPGGGNPAGVVLDASTVAADPATMLAIAADVGYSETVFVTDGPVTAGRRDYTVRYFSPQVEVPFCGHATIALGVAVGRRIGAGAVTLSTKSGPVRVDVEQTATGRWRATLTSPPPSHQPLPADQLDAVLDCFGWTRDVLALAPPPTVAFAGARHVVLVLHQRATLGAAAYDYDRLRDLSVRHEWVTIQLAYRETPQLHHVRAPFPFGGVVEDPATGAGAAAYAAYLRDTGTLAAPTTLTIRQGDDMGRPSVLAVEVPAAGPVRVTGEAVPLSG
jgi:PhzF family phenazine biosynthesis protein